MVAVVGVGAAAAAAVRTGTSPCSQPSASTNVMPASIPTAPTIMRVNCVALGRALTACAAVPVMAEIVSSFVGGSGAGPSGVMESTSVGAANVIPA